MKSTSKQSNLDNTANLGMIFDVTQLVHWGGRLTGIPRVMFELASRYANEKDTRFVTWDTHTSAYYEVDILATLRRRGEGIFYLSPQSSPVDKSTKTSQSILKRIARKLYHIAKTSNIPGINSLQKYINRTEHKNHIMVVPQNGQKLFIPWGEWADSKFTEMVARWSEEGVKVVIVSHDMLPVLMPQFSGHSTDSVTYATRIAIPKAALVLAVSDNTKSDLSNWLKSEGLQVPRIEVIRNGDNFSKTKPVKPMTAVKGDFLLCVGTIEVRKNHWLLYYVYKLASQRGITLPPLVIVGRRGWRTDDVYNVITSDPEINQKIKIELDASDEALAWFYKNARFTIYPSFYEGWGIPVAESLTYGTPCICSNTSSIPEVAGDLVGYFSPASTDECLAQILKLMDEDYYKEAVKKTSKFKPSLWDETYNQTKAYIRSLDEFKN